MDFVMEIHSSDDDDDDDHIDDSVRANKEYNCHAC